MLEKELRRFLIILLKSGLVVIFSLINIATSLAQGKTEPIPLDSIIRANPQWGEWTQNPTSYQAEVLLTSVVYNRDGKAIRGASSHWGNTESGLYFYPASTVKMPITALALEWVRKQGVVGMDAHTFMSTGVGRSPQTARETDPTTAHGFPTIAQYIRKVFLVSDNDAYNRLYELLGQDYINERLHQMGLTESRIIHRLSVGGFDREGNSYYNPVHFHYPDKTLFQRTERYGHWKDTLRLNGELRGQGYIDSEGELVENRFDFSEKNYLSLANLHGIIQRIVMPDWFAPDQLFQLSPADYPLLWKPMTEMPRKSESPAYSDKPDNYVKFWLFGDKPENYRIPDHITSYNKVGLAYGYLTDIAYIEDRKHNVAYFISGTIHVNENEIYNDGKYEYDEVGFPFFGQLGRAIHEYLTGEKL